MHCRSMGAPGKGRDILTRGIEPLDEDREDLGA
jgi:hypothetical protein